MIHLCNFCIYYDECNSKAIPQVVDCADFEDGYPGPEYPDGDAYQEWLSATFFDLEPVGHGEIDEGTCPD